MTRFQAGKNNDIVTMAASAGSILQALVPFSALVTPCFIAKGFLPAAKPRTLARKPNEASAMRMLPRCPFGYLLRYFPGDQTGIQQAW